MAYFPNGTAGEFFESAECRGCVHEDDHESEKYCAILSAHMLFNYDQIQDHKRDNPLAQVLTLLIDDENRPLGKMCAMRMSTGEDVDTLPLFTDAAAEAPAE